MQEQIFAPKPKLGEAWDVAIVGSGPAALTAAVYTTRGAASTLIIAGEKWGGQLMLTSMVDNFPGFPEGIMGPDLMLNMRKQAVRFGAEFLEKNATKIDITKSPFEIQSGEEVFFVRSIIIATGAATNWLNIPGEAILIGRGVSSCAPCDAPFFKEKTVAVIGGGDSAMEEALVLTKYASKVYVIHRRDSFKASKIMQDKVFNSPKIEVIWNTEVKEAVGVQKLEKIKIFNKKTNQGSELAIDGMFVAIGHKPESEIFKGHVDTDEKGYIKLHNMSQTSVEGIYVSGDVHDYHYRQAVTAAGYGAMAGLDVLKYLEENKQHARK